MRNIQAGAIPVTRFLFWHVPGVVQMGPDCTGLLCILADSVDRTGSWFIECDPA